MEKFNAKKFAVLLIIAFAAIICAICFLFINNREESKETSQSTVPAQTKEHVTESEYALKDKEFSKFDLSFLKFENKDENKIYSPLSIKYAFKMLEEATTGNSQKQIADIITNYDLTKYESNENMALANAFFVKDAYKENVKQNYIDLLKTKYNADVEFDDFSGAEKINQWVKEHTLNLIPEVLDDSDLEELNFALVNCLGIDMEWNHKFFDYFEDELDDSNITSSTVYSHEKIPNEEYGFSWYGDEGLTRKKFSKNQEVSSMKVYATLNNYDVVSEIGEDNIRRIVYDDFKDWALGNGKYTDSEWNGQKDDYTFKGDYSEENIRKIFDNWYDNPENESENYINSIKSNYGKTDYTTDFSIYVDDDVKVFAKDLKEYDGTTLQYIGIMPQKEELSSYIDHVKNTDITNLISKLKELKRENFKDGYLTYIHGYIPKFSFEYDLDLQKDLEKMNVTDVFEEGKANLKELTNDENAFIGSLKHKANIEFTQDGIKAAAVTIAGGAGAGDWYDYCFEMPTEEIDITFDKPYLFLIRDKETKETWFVGTVYEPLDADLDESEEFMGNASEDFTEE